MKTTKLRVTKKIRNILLLILKHKNQLKFLNSKKFWSWYLSELFLIWKNAFYCHFLIYWSILINSEPKSLVLFVIWLYVYKFYILSKNSLFIPNLCYWSTNHMLLYPQIGYFLPENFIFWLEVSELIETNILSYHILKSLCKQNSYNF